MKIIKIKQKYKERETRKFRSLEVNFRRELKNILMSN
jgi:hypothetical protein